MAPRSANPGYGPAHANDHRQRTCRPPCRAKVRSRQCPWRRQMPHKRQPHAEQSIENIAFEAVDSLTLGLFDQGQTDAERQTSHARPKVTKKREFAAQHGRKLPPVLETDAVISEEIRL